MFLSEASIPKRPAKKKGARTGAPGYRCRRPAYVERAACLISRCSIASSSCLEKSVQWRQLEDHMMNGARGASNMNRRSMHLSFVHWKVAYGLRRTKYTGSMRAMRAVHLLHVSSNAGGKGRSGAGSLWGNISSKGRLSSVKSEVESSMAAHAPLCSLSNDEMSYPAISIAKRSAKKKGARTGALGTWKITQRMARPTVRPPAHLHSTPLRSAD